MTGKEKCRLLRQIRSEIAKANGITYYSPECTYMGNDCPGTCPKCDAEIRYLDSELNRKAAAGQKITLSGLSLDSYQQNVSDDKGYTWDKYISNQNGPGNLLDQENQVPPPPPPPEWPELHTAGVMVQRDPVLDKPVAKLNMSVLFKWWLDGEQIKTVEDLQNLVKYNADKLRKKNLNWYREAVRQLENLGLECTDPVASSVTIPEDPKGRKDDPWIDEVDTGFLELAGEALPGGNELWDIDQTPGVIAYADDEEMTLL